MSNEKKIPTLYRGKRETMPQTGKIAEPRFTTDTNELFINDGDGKNVLVGSPNSIKFKFNYLLTAIVVIAGELMITALNTGSLFIDSKIYGYYSPVFIFGSLGIRLVICVGKAIVISVVLPALMKAVGNIKEVAMLRGESN